MNSKIDYGPVIGELDKLLKHHGNKTVVAFHRHGIPEDEEFFALFEFWRMLKANNFTDRFVEARPEHRSLYDKFAPSFSSLGKKSLKQLAQESGATQGERLRWIYRYATHAVSMRSGLAITFIDKGIATHALGWDKAKDAYYKTLRHVWSQHIAANRIDVNNMTIETQVAQWAAYLKDFIKTTEAAPLREALAELLRFSPVHLARLDDEATGTFSAEQAKLAKGRVWVNYGDGHFTPCGIHTYLNDPLILDIYTDLKSYSITQEMRKYPNIFPPHKPKPEWTRSFVVLLKEGKIGEWPARPYPAPVRELTINTWKKQTRQARNLLEAKS